MAGRPRKTGLNYRSSSTNKYEDFRMVDLLDKYGPAGAIIYDVISDMVLKQGYYLKIPLQNLALSIQKTVGSKWIRNRDFVLQVVQYCADIGLFDKDLLQQSVITSVELQESYSIGTVRSKVQIEEYRLIEEKGKPLLSVPQKGNCVTEMPINVTEIANDETEMQRRVGLGNNIYISIFQNPDLERAFQLYIVCREKHGERLTEEQIALLRKEVLEVSTDEAEQLASIKKATIGNWKSFYPVSKKKKEVSKQKSPAKNKFNNFESRNYDFDSLEKQLLNR